ANTWPLHFTTLLGSDKTGRRARTSVNEIPSVVANIASTYVSAIRRLLFVAPFQVCRDFLIDRTGMHPTAVRAVYGWLSTYQSGSGPISRPGVPDFLIGSIRVPTGKSYGFDERSGRGRIMRVENALPRGYITSALLRWIGPCREGRLKENLFCQQQAFGRGCR